VKSRWLLLMALPSLGASGIAAAQQAQPLRAGPQALLVGPPPKEK
jgi:hypothetical protein